MIGFCSSRNRLAVPWGMLGALALIVAFECVEFRDNPCFTNFHSATWSYSARGVARQAPGRAILCFGDSMVKFGVLPKVIRERSGKSGYNLAVTVGTAPSSYVLLKRALRSGARPEAVVVDFASGILGMDPHHGEITFPWTDLLSVGESLELSWAASDAGLFALSLLERGFHSVKGRFEVRDHVMKALRGEFNPMPIQLAISQRNWNRNAGAQAQTLRPFEDLPFPTAGVPLEQTRWRCHPANEWFLRKFLTLAAQRGIRVYWLLPPISPGLQACKERHGEEAAVEAFVRRVQSGYPKVVVVDGRHSGFDRTAFFDPSHLDSVGAVSVSEGLGAILSGPQPVAATGTRWVKLPEFRKPPAMVAVEDMGQSQAAFYSSGARTRVR